MNKKKYVQWIHVGNANVFPGKLIDAYKSTVGNITRNQIEWGISNQIEINNIYEHLPAMNCESDGSPKKLRFSI